MISEVKRVEIRDRMTFIPALAFSVSGDEEDRLMWRGGFGPEPYVILIHMLGTKVNYDPFNWTDRTMRTAHRWLLDHWDEHLDGGVVDVEFILGETLRPKSSELG